MVTLVQTCQRHYKSVSAQVQFNSHSTVISRIQTAHYKPQDRVSCKLKGQNHVSTTPMFYCSLRNINNDKSESDQDVMRRLR